MVQVDRWEDLWEALVGQWEEEAWEVVQVDLWEEDPWARLTLR